MFTDGIAWVPLRPSSAGGVFFCCERGWQEWGMLAYLRTASGWTAEAKQLASRVDIRVPRQPGKRLIGGWGTRGAGGGQLHGDQHLSGIRHQLLIKEHLEGTSAQSDVVHHDGRDPMLGVRLGGG